jgi:hypothetical protein
VSADGAGPQDLEHAIARVYGGPPEGFVGGRSDLAKELRAAGRREDAARVKGLRKPSRMAWALDAAALDAADAMGRLEAAVDGVRAAQSSGRDLRGAIGELRAAVRFLADAAAAGAAERGHPVDGAALVNAILAVIADAAAFDALRASRLVDIPEAGGLDLLTAGWPAAGAADATRVEPDAGAAPVAETGAARQALDRAETVVLIVGISLAAYIASKLLGARVGTLLGGALGGLISSTAATVSYARRTRGAAEAVDGAAIMIVIASTIVFVRVLFEVAVVAPEVLTAVAAPLGVVLALLGAIAAASYARARRALRPPAHIGAPSDLRAAIVFGGLYAAVLFAVALAKEHLGERGLFAVAALSGLTDVDAITLSTAQLLKAGRLDLDTGWRLILTGALANLVFKAAAVAVLGHRRLFARIALQFGIALAGGAAVLAFWPA